MDFLDGKKTRIKKGYHYCGKKLLHRLIWEHYNGPIPIGMVIHHKNGDKLNNSLENLACISQSEHCRLHRYEEREVLSKRMSANSKKIHAWLYTEVGKKFLSEKAKKEAAERPERDFVCQVCLKPFKSKSTKQVKYCSDNCVMKARRLRNADMEDRECIICRGPFTINKYQLTKTCSKPCRAKYIGNLKRKS